MPRAANSLCLPTHKTSEAASRYTSGEWIGRGSNHPIRAAIAPSPASIAVNATSPERSPSLCRNEPITKPNDSSKT